MVDDVGEWCDVSATGRACFMEMPAEQADYGAPADGGIWADADTGGFEAAAGDGESRGNGAVEEGREALSESCVEMVWCAERGVEVAGEGEREVARRGHPKADHWGDRDPSDGDDGDSRWLRLCAWRCWCPCGPRARAAERLWPSRCSAERGNGRGQRRRGS